MRVRMPARMRMPMRVLMSVRTSARMRMPVRVLMSVRTPPQHYMVRSASAGPLRMRVVG